MKAQTGANYRKEVYVFRNVYIWYQIHYDDERVAQNDYIGCFSSDF